MIYFLIIPTFGVGAPISRALKIRVPAVQGFSEKYRSAARMIFPENRFSGLTLLRR